MRGSISEYQYNSDIADKMLKLIKESYPQLDAVKVLRDGHPVQDAYAACSRLGCDAVIELHFNAFDGKASGTETLCTGSVNDIEFAHIIQDQMCKAFNRQGSSRGVKVISRAARGGVNVHSFPLGVNCLVEPFFGDNVEEANLALAMPETYVAALVNGVVLWGKKIDLLR